MANDKNFDRVQEFQNGLAGDEAGRPFIDVIEDHMLLYSHVCSYCKDSEPYTAFHRMLRSLSWDAVAQLDLLKKFLIEMKESEVQHDAT